ncbi:unnamed protein product [Sphagnum balticum]
MIQDELEALFFDYLQVEDVGSGSQACLIWLSKFQRLLANINALGQTGQLLSRDRAAKNGRESTCVSGFQNPKAEDSSLELDMMFIYMKFLVLLGASDDDFIRHAAGKTILALSEYFIFMGSVESWSALVSLLWDSTTLGTASVLIELLGDLLGREDHDLKAYSSNVAAIEASAVTVGKETTEYGTAPTSFETMFGLLAKVSTISGPNFKSIILHKMQTMHKARIICTSYGGKNWGSVLCSLEVLHQISKKISNKASSDSNSLGTMKIFLRFLGENISAVVEQLLSDDAGSRIHNDKFQGELALGALLQLLCTALQKLELNVGEHDSKYLEIGTLLVKNVGELIPVLAQVALVSHKPFGDASFIPSFLRHKFLRLMLVLSGRFKDNQALALVCLRALCYHGADLITFTLCETSEISSLENNLLGSCFASSQAKTQVLTTNQGADAGTLRHLQRRALLLLFRIKAYCNVHSSSVALQSGADYSRDNSGTSTVDCASEANSAILNWLRIQSHDFTNEKHIATELSTLLVQFYIDEDDLMIEMLLQCLKWNPSQLESTELEPGIHDLVSEFMPLHLFNALLAAIMYDHMVLVDFLISETTGPLCLQYVLGCLRLMMSISAEFGHANGVGSTSILAPLEGQVKRQKFWFQKTVECLLELKVTIERLHHRHLFPYNPSVLLKRLCVLEELLQKESL